MEKNATPTGRGARPTDEASVEARENLARWAKTFSDQVIDNVIHYRNLRKLKNEEFRDRLRQLGWVLTENSLAGILGKKRTSMPITDVMLFAWALNVPPLYLAFPIHSNAEVQVTPVAAKRPVPYRDFAYDAARWFIGEDGDGHPGPEFRKHFDSVDDWYEVGDTMSRLEDIDENMLNLVTLNNHLLSSTGVSDEQRDSWRRDLLEHVSEISSLRGYLRNVFPDLPLPQLPSELGFIDDRTAKVPPFPLPKIMDARMSSRRIQSMVDRIQAMPEDEQHARWQRLADLEDHIPDDAIADPSDDTGSERSER